MSSNIEQIEYKDIKIPVIYEKDILPTFNLQLVFKNSGAIKNNIAGLSSISAKILNEGSKKQGNIKFFENLENKAISIHTSSGFETFVIEVSALKSEYKTAMKALKELIKDPNYSQKVLEKVKTMQIGSLKRKENDFDYIASNELKNIMFKDTILALPSSGTVHSIKEIQLKDVKEFISNVFSLNNLIIVAGGDLSLNEIKKDLPKILNELNTKKAKKLKTFTVNKNSTNSVMYKETKQAYIYFGSAFNTSVLQKDNYISKVASFILGGSGFGSRLMEEIRVKRGLAYSAYGSISINQSYSKFSGYLQTKIKNAEESQTLVKQIVKDFVKDGVKQEELDAAKNFLTGSEPLRVETLSQRLNLAFHLYYKGLEQNYSQKELTLIENLSLEDLNNYIKEHNEIEDIFFSIVTSKKED